MAFVLAASVPFLVVFAGCIATSIGPPDPARRLLWDRVLIGGAVLTGAMAPVVAIVHLSLADGANHGVSALFIPFADFFALLLTGVWIIATSVTLSCSASGVNPAAPALHGSPNQARRS